MQNTTPPPDTDLPDDPTLSDLLTAANNQAEPFEIMDDVVQKPKRKRKRKFYFANIRLYAAVAGIAALTTLVIAGVVLVAVTPYFVIVTPTTVYPTMIPQYGPDSWNWDTPLTTNGAVGTIGGGILVHIKAMSYNTSASDWQYTVQDEQGQQADAMTWQLMPVPQPTPTAFPFAQDIGMGALFITTEPVGIIPANTRVRISQATTDADGWVYTIVTEDEQQTAAAHAWQLTYAPGVIPGMTPTSPFNGIFGTGQFAIITRVQIGDIPPNTLVNIGSGHFNGREWAYSIMTDDGHYADNALQSQLAPAQFAPPPTPLETMPPTTTPIP